MKKNRGCWSGCLVFLLGLLLGAGFTFVFLVGWAYVRPVDDRPLTARLEPGASDLELTLSEAYLNRVANEEVANRDLDNIGRVIIDTQPESTLLATVEGSFDLGGLLPAVPKVDAVIVLSTEDGLLTAHIAQVSAGFIVVDRESVPELILPLFQTLEDAIVRAVNKPLLLQGFEADGVRTGETSLTMGLNEK